MDLTLKEGYWLQFIQKLQSVVETEQYTTRSMANNTIKINCIIPDTYRKLVKFMNENNIIHPTYQTKDERAYRVAIKYLHHSIDTNEVAEELASQGLQVRNIIDAKQRQSKEPLNLFFVDLEPAENNKDIYKIRKLFNRLDHQEKTKTSSNA
jgi:3-methyladenine DNA glycosylase AlkC